MIAGIITIPSRKESVQELIALISPSVDRLEVFVDEQMQGQFFNYSRCLTAMLDSAKINEPVLICTDDVITIPGWRERWERLHAAAKNEIYVLFNRKRNLLLNQQNIDRGYVTGCHPRGYYDQAAIFINQHGLMRKILDWFEVEGQYHPKVNKRKTHLDVVVQEYLIHYKKPWTVSVPSLFDHKLIKSSLGHAVGVSPNYIGNQWQ